MTIVTKTQLENASLDAATLEAVINGSSTPGTLTSRQGTSLKTIAKIIAELSAIDIGGSAAALINARIDDLEDSIDTQAELITLLQDRVTALELNFEVPPPPSAVLEYWQVGKGMFQDSAMLNPVTSPGQTIAKWVGQKLGTVLTITNGIIQASKGQLVPKLNQGFMKLPTGYSTGKQNLTILLHVQRPGCFQTHAFFGMGTSGRVCELQQYGSIQLATYDGVGSVLYHNNTAKASPCTISARLSSSNRKIGVNGTEITAAVMANASMSGGNLFALHDDSLPSADRVFGIALSTNLGDVDFASTVEWANNVRARPSDTNPTTNLVVFGDSQFEGLNSGGDSSLFKLADNHDIRIIPVVGSATYYGVGSGPQNSSINKTVIGLEKLASSRNVILIATTNDFDQGSGGGAAHFGRVKSDGLAWQADGWEVWVAKQPNRVSPYSGATSFNTEVSAFNALLTSDPWMDGVIDLATPINGVTGAILSDGVHWTALTQTNVYNAIKTALGLV